MSKAEQEGIFMKLKRGLFEVYLDLVAREHWVAEKLLRSHVQGFEQDEQSAQIYVLVFVLAYAAICLIRNCRLVAKRVHSELSFLSQSFQFLSDKFIQQHKYTISSITIAISVLQW